MARRSQRIIIAILLIAFVMPCGAYADDRFDREIERQYGFYKDEAANARVQRIYARLESTLPSDKPHPKKVRIIKLSQMNAFATKDSVYLTSRIVNECSDEELAAVMAHEVAHVTERHVQKGQNRSLWLLLLGVAAGVLIKNSDGKPVINDPGSRNTIIISNIFLNNKFTEGDERQADAMGIEMMARAGYNPDGMASLFKKIGAGMGDVPIIGFVLSDHPATSRRMKVAQQRAKELQPVYIAAKEKFEGPPRTVAAAQPQTQPTVESGLPGPAQPSGATFSGAAGQGETLPNIAHLWHQGYLLDDRPLALRRLSPSPAIELWGSNIASSVLKLYDEKRKVLNEAPLVGEDASFSIDTSLQAGSYVYEVVVTFKDGLTRTITIPLTIESE